MAGCGSKATGSWAAACCGCWRSSSARVRTTHAAGALGVGQVASQVDQQPDAVTGGALADVFAPDVPGGAGDVEVDPRLAVHELLQERAGVDRPGLALRRGVGEVGDGALGEVLVLGVE